MTTENQASDFFAEIEQIISDGEITDIKGNCLQVDSGRISNWLLKARATRETRGTAPREFLNKWLGNEWTADATGDKLRINPEVFPPEQQIKMSIERACELLETYAAERVSQPVAPPPPRWISVATLPEFPERLMWRDGKDVHWVSGEVIVWDENSKRRTVAELFRTNDEAPKWIERYARELSNVTHWQPLPEPPCAPSAPAKEPAC